MIDNYGGNKKNRMSSGIKLVATVSGLMGTMLVGGIYLLSIYGSLSAIPDVHPPAILETMGIFLILVVVFIFVLTKINK